MLQTTSYVPAAKLPPTLMRTAASSSLFASPSGRPGRSSASRIRGRGGNSVVSNVELDRLLTSCGRSRTQIAIVAAAMNELTAPNTNTKPIPPNIAAPTPPIAGPKRRPPICAAPYRPNASPCRAGGVASVM
jgi:hypothetical protein